MAQHRVWVKFLGTGSFVAQAPLDQRMVTDLCRIYAQQEGLFARTVVFYELTAEEARSVMRDANPSGRESTVLAGKAQLAADELLADNRDVWLIATGQELQQGG